MGPVDKEVSFGGGGGGLCKYDTPRSNFRYCGEGGKGKRGKGGGKLVTASKRAKELTPAPTTLWQYL